ncbi:hypothetical protein KVV02_002475 [Mortierella alpina]|uniref:XPG-I domain-containing protein n=1 Tax=Mortierella alpina TaxID=64518 RepID=A0A9P7ZXD7_MORAP|nr:hypothetical protein KVV02_002475 [Mortierella alpina]
MKGVATNPLKRRILDAVRHIYAYIRHPPHTAQQIIEKEISKLGDKSRLILYVDGHQANEKQATHDARGATRAVAKAEAQKLLSEIKDRVKKDLSVRKWRLDNTDKSIKKSFYWNVHDRAPFCRHMEHSGWTVQTAATEADVAIAREIEPGDVAISRDCDMLIYGRICMLYRRISRGRFLVHDIQEVAASLDLTRAQLTILGVVSHNDYNRNISSLGTATNHKIIRELSHAESEKMVQSYLSHDQVALKNTTKESLALSTRVFVHFKQ